MADGLDQLEALTGDVDSEEQAFVDQTDRQNGTS